MEVKLKIKVKDVEIELSKNDAEELRKLLNDLCGERVIKEYVPYYPYWRYWYDTTPIPCVTTWVPMYTAGGSCTIDGNTGNVAVVGDNIQVSYCMS
jgi:hypothetical protein